LGLTPNPGAIPELEPEFLVEWVDQDGNGNPDSIPLPSIAPDTPPWTIHLVGVGEFDGDGAPDLVFTYDIITDGQPIRHVMVSFADGDFQEAVQWVNTDLWNVTAIGDIDADG